MVVKNTFRTMMLAAAGVLGSVAVAQAQPAPAPPAPDQPSQPAPPAPPPADFGVAPAALPAAPAPSAPPPTVSWGAQPPGDTTTPATTPAPEKKGNPFFFTRFTWGNSATTQMFGIGQDYQGSDGQQYVMDFGLNLRYYAINEPLDKLWINVNGGVGVELTNADNTTTKHQPLLKDTSVGLGYSHNVYRNADKTIVTTPGISANYILPTSLASREQGKFGSLSMSAALTQVLPIAGPKSDWFSDIFIVGSVGWSHLFSKATTPVNDIVGIVRPRQGLDPTTPDVGEQLSGGAFAHDNARLNFTYYLTIYKDLSLGNTWEILMPFKYQFGDTNCVKIDTGCVAVGKSQTAFNPITTFDIGLSYSLFNMARIDVGYTNTTLALDDNQGHRRSIFYGPDAAFYGNVSVYIDSILDKTLNLTGEKTARRAAQRSQLTNGAF